MKFTYITRVANTINCARKKLSCCRTSRKSPNAKTPKAKKETIQFNSKKIIVEEHNIFWEKPDPPNWKITCHKKKFIATLRCCTIETDRTPTEEDFLEIFMPEHTSYDKARRYQFSAFDRFIKIIKDKISEQTDEDFDFENQQFNLKYGGLICRPNPHEIGPLNSKGHMTPELKREYDLLRAEIKELQKQLNIKNTLSA